MPSSITDYNQADQRIWEEELDEFVPSRVFDAHIHMLDQRHLSPEKSQALIVRSNAAPFTRSG